MVPKSIISAECLKLTTIFRTTLRLLRHAAAQLQLYMYML